MKLNLRATGYHLPYGITQCYLSPDTSEHTSPSPQHTGGIKAVKTRLIGTHRTMECHY